MINNLGNYTTTKWRATTSFTLG